MKRTMETHMNSGDALLPRICFGLLLFLLLWENDSWHSARAMGNQTFYDSRLLSFVFLCLPLYLIRLLCHLCAGLLRCLCAGLKGFKQDGGVGIGGVRAM